MLLFNLSTEFDEKGKQNQRCSRLRFSVFLFIVQFYDIILSITFFFDDSTLFRDLVLSQFSQHT